MYSYVTVRPAKEGMHEDKPHKQHSRVQSRVQSRTLSRVQSRTLSRALSREQRSRTSFTQISHLYPAALVFPKPGGQKAAAKPIWLYSAYVEQIGVSCGPGSQPSISFSTSVAPV